jgi:phage tail sheath protein FI
MAETIISPGVFARENDISFIQPAPVEAGAAIIGPAVKGPVEEPTIVTSYNQYVRNFGETFVSASTKQEYLTSIAVKNYFQQGGSSVLVTRVVTGSFTQATSTHVSASVQDSTQPFVLKTLGKGALFNNSLSLTSPGVEIAGSGGALISGSTDNIRWEIANKDNAKGTFSLLVRRGDDSHNNKVVLETFNNISLDPNSSNYIEKVIGTQYKTKATDGSKTYVKTVGDYVNKSNYIYVSAVNLPTVDYLQNDGTTVNEDAAGTSYSASLPINESGSFYNATGTNAVASANYFDNISNTNAQGLTSGNYTDAISILDNKDEYIFNVLSTPGLVYENSDQAGVLNSVITLAESRGDCIAVVDLDNYGSTVSNITSTATSLNSSYASSYWPWVQVVSATGRNVWAPASVVVPGIYAFTDNSSAPWFAPAGLVRGGIVGVIQAEQKLTRTQRDSLYDGKVNPIATFPGQGIAVFGQKTLQTKASALDRVNVRRLLIQLKKFLGDQARNLVFEQNTVATRNRFLSVVNPYLESVVQRQGLYAFRVVMDDTNNTADVVDRNQLVGQIFIQPAKTAEFIVLDFTVEPTGATFAG